MASNRNSVASFAQPDAANLLAGILGSLPDVPSGEFQSNPKLGGAPQTEAPREQAPAASQASRRLAKLKHKLHRQSNFMAELKRKIREKESMRPKADCDREELAFLRNRLQKEGELQRRLLEEVVGEQRRTGADTDGSQWQSIRLCPDKLDESGASPWTMSSVPPLGDFQQCSCDSALSVGSSSNGERTTDCAEKLTERFEKELLNRDRVIEILQTRLDRLTADVRKVRRGGDDAAVFGQQPTVTASSSVPGPRYCETDMLQRLEFYRTNTDRLGKNLEHMEHALECIQKELGPLTESPRKDTKSSHVCTSDITLQPPSDARPSIVGFDRQQCPKDLETQKQYGLLLQEYTKKTTECRQLSEQLAKAHAGPPEPSSDETEREMLKKRCTELLDEQDEFRVLIREQALQLEDYRSKYLDAQQKTEEQRLQMDKLRITNKRVETQINCEIEQIKRKFQDRLRELTPYPRLLEDEQAKAEQLKQSNQRLYEELERALRQVKVLEDRLVSAQAAKEAEVQQALQHTHLELEQLREQNGQLVKDCQKSEEGATKAQSDLDELRAESTRIVARANQRLEQERQAAQQRYAQLEAELARCRAEASFTISNREDALREMHNQIRVLSGSFDDAQLQIRSLRNQLSYLQNEKLVCLA